MAKAVYRDRGAVGALLDEYEKALGELSALVSTLTQEELVTVVDKETRDADCRSIQTILTHVVSAGYYYATAVMQKHGKQQELKEKKLRASAAEYLEDLSDMFAFNEKLFDDFPNLQLENHKEEDKILTLWGQRFDVEQIYEHAIVHILRHRRQIERFLIKLRINK